MPNLRVENLGGSLKILRVDNTDLPRDRRFTYLTEDVVAAGSTIRVQSIIGFESVSTSSGQVLLIGEVDNERTEVIRTTNASANGYPSQTYKEIALRDVLRFDHPQDTKVAIIDWDRIEFNYAASVTGTKTTISAYPLGITPDQKETLFRDTTEPANRLSGAPATAFYFARYNNTIDGRNSDFSDATYGTGYDDNSVFSIKKRAIDELGEEIDGKTITHEFLNQSLWEARREYHEAPGKRPFRRKFGAILGSSALTGSFRVELPTDVERPWTAENIYGVRIGTSPDFTYYDKKEFDFDYRNKPHSTTELPYVYNTSTSIWLANGRDFDKSATINIEGINIGVTRYEYSLTGNSLFNSLRIYSHPTGAYSTSAGSDAWQNISLGLPDKFTVFADPGGSSYIYFNRPIDTAYVNQNIYVDYYRTLLGFNSDADVLDEPNYDMFVNFLKAKVKDRRVKGTGDITQDSDFKVWLSKKAESLSRETISTDLNIKPGIDHLPLPQ